MSIKPIILTLLLLSFPVIAFTSPPVQVWHTVSGNCVTGRLEKVEGGVVYLQVNGQTIHIQAAKLAPEDRITASMAQYVYYDSNGTPIGLKANASEFARKSFFAWNVRRAEEAGACTLKIAPMGVFCERPDIPATVLDIGALNATFYDELNNPKERWYMICHRDPIEQMQNGNFTTSFWDDEAHRVDVYFGRDVVQELYALPEENWDESWLYFVKGKLGTTEGRHGNKAKGIIVGKLNSNARSFSLSEAVRERLEAMTEENWQAIRDELLGR